MYRYLTSRNPIDFVHLRVISESAPKYSLPILGSQSQLVFGNLEHGVRATWGHEFGSLTRARVMIALGPFKRKEVTTALKLAVLFISWRRRGLSRFASLQ